MSRCVSSICYDGEYGLTWFSLLDLFGRQRERGEKLHQYLDKEFSHGNRGSDLRIDFEAI